MTLLSGLATSRTCERTSRNEDTIAVKLGSLRNYAIDHVWHGRTFAMGYDGLCHVIDRASAPEPTPMTLYEKKFLRD